MSTRMKTKQARREARKAAQHPTPKRKPVKGLQMQWRPLSERRHQQR